MVFHRADRRRHGSGIVDGERRDDLVLAGSGEKDWPVSVGEELTHDRGALLGSLSRCVDRLWKALTERTVVIDPGESQIGTGQTPQAGGGLVGADDAGADIVEELA